MPETSADRIEGAAAALHFARTGRNEPCQHTNAPCERLAARVLAALAEHNAGLLAETHTEWGVKHSQGLREERSEESAREWLALDNKRHDEGRVHYGTMRSVLVRREVTDWQEVRDA